MRESKVKRIFRNAEKEVDIIILKNATDPHIDQSFFYVTGLTSGLFEGASALLYPDGKLEVITSPLEEESARKGDFRVTVYRSREKAAKLLENRLRGMKRIGVNNDELTCRDYFQLKKTVKNGKLLDVSAAIRKTRVTKDDEELARMRTACDIASAVAARIPGILRQGVRESDIAAEVSYQMRKAGAQHDAFTTICAFGPNSAEPHYTSGERKLASGDFVVIDYGASYKKYCSDITRTFVCGKASARHREIYALVKELQELALDEIRAGAEGKPVQEVVDKKVAKTKYRGRFTHGIGHSLGLCAHDGYGFAYPPELVLEENMVFTVEPGIYLPGFGGVRIEDDIVVTKKGYKLLTHADRNLISV